MHTKNQKWSISQKILRGMSRGALPYSWWTNWSSRGRDKTTKNQSLLFQECLSPESLQGFFWRRPLPTQPFGCNNQPTASCNIVRTFALTEKRIKGGKPQIPFLKINLQVCVHIQRCESLGHTTLNARAFFGAQDGNLTRGNDIRVTPGMTTRGRFAPCAPPLYCHAIFAQILVVP